MSNESRRYAGFTLIEIAIVVAIIGILSTVAGSNYLRFLDRARTARAIVELRGIAAELDAAGDDGHAYPSSLSGIGRATTDPWGRAYRYLRLAGSVPLGASSTSTRLPAVAAAPQRPAGEQAAMGEARKDRFLVPINSDYDLYSVGPDGKTSPPLSHQVSRDDIIRAADGAFYGAAEEF
jgi:general secretion pathway protein G